MTHSQTSPPASGPDPPLLRCAVPDPDRPIPLTTRRLRDDEEPSARDDYITPLAGTVTVVSVLATTCVPLSAVVAATSADMSDPAVEGPIRTTLILALVFLFIAMAGTVAGIAAIFRKNWGRLLLLGYAAAVLVFEGVAIGLRLRYGVEGLTETAPTDSALTLHLTCVGGVFVVVAALMVVTLRYFTLPHVKERFR